MSWIPLTREIQIFRPNPSTDPSELNCFQMLLCQLSLPPNPQGSLPRQHRRCLGAGIRTRRTARRWWGGGGDGGGGPRHRQRLRGGGGGAAGQRAGQGGGRTHLRQGPHPDRRGAFRRCAALCRSCSAQAAPRPFKSQPAGSPAEVLLAGRPKRAELHFRSGGRPCHPLMRGATLQ